MNHEEYQRKMLEKKYHEEYYKVYGKAPNVNFNSMLTSTIESKIEALKKRDFIQHIINTPWNQESLAPIFASQL